MLRTVLSLTLAGAVALGVAPASPATATPGPAGPSAYGPRDVPRGAPAAAHRAEPRLRTPAGWPFEQRVSRTSGTGRLHDGASYWTDFVHDDHGAALPGGLTLENTSRLAPEQGVYSYPGGSEGPARANGADVFVAATGADRRATYWRVDWNTLTDPGVPLAVWGFDTDRDATTGTDRWPAQAQVTSPGLDLALVVSGRGAWLVDPGTGERTDVTARGGDLTVDRAARSFVVRVPRTLMAVSGSWRVRLAAGLAAEDGRTFAVPEVADGTPAPPSAPRVYNVGYRTVAQEPPIYRDGRTDALVAEVAALAGTVPEVAALGLQGQTRFVTGNFWMEDHQADALALGDVSDFSRTVDWSALARRTRTPEPLVRGYSNRWYATRLNLGQGVVEDADGGGSGDGRPNYLGRIQPYAVQVPRSYDPAEPAPLTWVLHSLGVNHNQYGGYDPRLRGQLCASRDSICASTLGFGPDGWYFDEAEVDYWSVWNAVAKAYSLDTRRTVVSGYSMGGWATYKLGLSHPDLYAEAVALAAPPQCGVSADGDQVSNPAFGGRCASDGTSAELVGNARWLPYRIGQGQLDQLVPFTSVEAQVRRFDDQGLRHRFVRYPGEDHLAFAVQDRFDEVVSGLRRPRVEQRPRRIDHTWHPHLTRPALGIGTTTAYWTSGLAARRSGPGDLARVQATSTGVPARSHTVERRGPTPVTAPLPAVRTDLLWRDGGALPTGRRLDLDLENVSRVVVDMARAGLRCGTVVARTDGPTRLVLAGLPGGRRAVDLQEGRTVRRIGC